MSDVRSLSAALKRLSSAFRKLGETCRRVASDVFVALADKLIDADSLCPECGSKKVYRNSSSGQPVCPIHCSKCGHDRKYEDYLDFCSQCEFGDPCWGH